MICKNIVEESINASKQLNKILLKFRQYRSAPIGFSLYKLTYTIETISHKCQIFQMIREATTIRWRNL